MGRFMNVLMISGAVLVLLGSATVACIVPMRRAVAVDPIRAIRSE